jgi:hypothetical protein
VFTLLDRSVSRPQALSIRPTHPQFRRSPSRPPQKETPPEGGVPGVWIVGLCEYHYLLVGAGLTCRIGCIGGRAERIQPEIPLILQQLVEREHWLADVLQFRAHRMFIYDDC